MTWNLNDPCFDWKGPSFGGFKHQNRGQTGSRDGFKDEFHLVFRDVFVAPPFC